MKTNKGALAALAGLALVLNTGCIVYRDRPVMATVQEAPPAPQVEAVPASPGPEYVWVEGYWSWHQRWVWAPGTWVIRPHSHAIWVGGHWSRGRRGWVWYPGHWR